MRENTANTYRSIVFGIIRPLALFIKEEFNIYNMKITEDLPAFFIGNNYTIKFENRAIDIEQALYNTLKNIYEDEIRDFIEAKHGPIYAKDLIEFFNNNGFDAAETLDSATLLLEKTAPESHTENFQNIKILKGYLAYLIYASCDPSDLLDNFNHKGELILTNNEDIAQTLINILERINEKEIRRIKKSEK